MNCSTGMELGEALRIGSNHIGKELTLFLRPLRCHLFCGRGLGLFIVQHKNTDTNPCQTVLRASQNQAPTLSIQESPAAALNLSSGNAGSCCKGMVSVFLIDCEAFLRICRIRSVFPGPGKSGREIRNLYTGTHGILSVKAAFRPEYSRYTWQIGKEPFHGVS